MCKIKRYLYPVIGLCILLLSFSAMAQKYGPTRASDSLWKIAKTVPTGDKPIKTMQVAYIIYKLNPDAFHANDMNELRKGVYLQLPENMQMLTQDSYKNARKDYQMYLQQLDLLQTKAKALAKAKSHYASWKRKFKKLKAKISSATTLRYEEKLVLSAQLKRAARKQLKWKKEIKRLPHWLAKNSKIENSQDNIPEIKTSQSPTVKPEKKQASNTEDETKQKQLTQLNTDNIDLKSRLSSLEDKIHTLLIEQKKEKQSHDQQIAQLQTELDNAKQTLQKRQKHQTEMEERLAVLEGELGDKEQVIQKLRSTLATAADTMKQQQLENENLQKKLKALDVSQVVNTTKRLKLMVTPDASPAHDISADTDSGTGVSSETTQQEQSSEAKTIQLLFTLSTLSLLLLLLFFYLRKTNRQRKFRKRMEVIELKLKPAENNKKFVDTSLKRSA